MTKTAFKNVGSLFAAQIITSILTPLLLIYIARKLGDEIFGKYSFALSLTLIFLVISEFGIKSVAIRDIARDSSSIGKYLRNIIGLKLAFSVLSSLIFVLFVTLLDLPRDTTLASYIFAGGLFFQSMSYAFRWVFHAMQIMEYEALQRVAERLLLLVMSVLVLWKGFGLIALSLVFLVTQLFILMLSFFFVARKFSLPRLKLNLSFCKYLIRTAVFFALCEVLWMIYFRIDIVMLAKLKGEIEVGWYNAAYVIVNVITLISMLLMQAMFPVLSSLYEKGKNKLRETAERLFRYLIIVAVIIVPVIFVFSDRIINLIYGIDYSHSIRALQVLIFAIIFLFPGNLFAHILASSNRHKMLALVNLVGVIVNILLNLILIPRYSYIGAGIATIVTEVILCFLLYTVVSRFIKTGILKIVSSLLPGLIAMVLIIYMAKNFPLIPVVILALVIFLSSAYLTGGIKKEDFSLLYEIIKKESSD
jgi:O-antigen/teichoic acid export membrane protein